MISIRVRIARPMRVAFDAADRFEIGHVEAGGTDRAADGLRDLAMGGRLR